MRTCLIPTGLALIASSVARADIVETGGDTVLAEPPPSILLDQWESDDIRVWFERETTLAQDITLGHSGPGFINDLSQISGDTVMAGTRVRSYMIRMDPVGAGPGSRSGYVVFDAEILGVYIGNQLVTTDDILGRPGVQYNQNSFRGMELDASDDGADAFEIAADLMRIDFTMEVPDWTDDIRVITAVPAPGTGVLMAGGLLSITRRRRA